MRYITIRKLSIDSLLMSISMFCVFTFAIMEHASISMPIFSNMKIPLLITSTICLILMMRAYIGKIFSKKYFSTFLALFVLILLLIWIAFMNRDPVIGTSTLRSTFRLILYLINLFVLMVVAAEKGQAQSVLRFLYHYLLTLAVANDVLMFSRLITFASGRHEIYLVGTKFSVCYLHMNLLTLWMMNNKRTIRSYRLSMWRVLLATAFILAVSVRVDCMTGIIGCLMLVGLFILIESPNPSRLLKFTSPGMLLAFLAGSVLFAFVAELILSLPIVSYLVKNVLGRDLSLTGRTSIYMLYTQTIPDHWLTGYGYGNAYAVTSTLFDFDNVQNGLLQWVLQIGIVATAGLVGLMMHIFSKITWKDSKNMPKILLMLALVYTYIILASIETTFNMAFLLWLAVIFLLVHERAPMRQRG